MLCDWNACGLSSGPEYAMYFSGVGVLEVGGDLGPGPR
jgi:hypothetical protein